MRKNIKKILISTSISILVFIFLTWAFITIKKNDDMLLKLSELGELQNKMMFYHLNYGRYPIVKEDILIKEYILCDSGFIKKDIKCDKLIWNPENLTIDFIYKNNDNNTDYLKDGLNYSVEFKINEDNKFLNCIHTRKENKKGCKITYDLKNGLIVEK